MSNKTEVSHEVTTDPFAVVDYVRRCLMAGIVPFLKGKPGVGKSAAIQALADEFDLEVIDVRLAQLDPTDLNGFPAPDLEKGRARFLVPEIFPIAGDPLPKNAEGQERKGWLLFLDELSNASNLVQGAAYKLILDRKVGQFDLHENCFIVAAGNRESDRAAAGKINSAMRSRLAHFTIESNLQKWCDWASEKGIDHRIISFLNFRPELLNNFDPTSNHNTYACERTWEAVHKFIGGSDKPIDHSDMMVPLTGIIGPGATQEFLGFVAVFADLPDLKDIENNPTTAKIPDGMDVKFALTGAIAEKLNKDNIDKFIQYIERLGIEFQILIIRSAALRDKELKSHSAVTRWSMKNAAQLGYINS